MNCSHWWHNDNVGPHLKFSATLSKHVFSYDMIGLGESLHRGWDHAHKQAMTLQTWSSIRAIDFLQSLTDVMVPLFAKGGYPGLYQISAA